MDKYTKLIIETSARCNLKCVMCPTLDYTDSKGMMSDDTYDKIKSYFHKLTWSDLTGWGEPLLDNKIFDRITQAETCGVPVHITTNGTLLNRERTAALLQARLTSITISLDGITKNTYENIRVNADFDSVLENIRRLVEMRNAAKAKLRVGINHVVMRQNIDELELAIDTFERMGVDSVHLKPLDVIWTRDLATMRLEREQIAKKITAIKSRPRNVAISCWNIFEADSPVSTCLARATEVPFISWDGFVSPCSNLGHPVSRADLDGNKFIKNTRFNLGNIHETSLDEIWYSETCIVFRHALKTGKLPDPCRFCNLGPKKTPMKRPARTSLLAEHMIRFRDRLNV
jgi:MoaA/NifB/PqqE/SkfB family radical SAM enzyme